MGREIKFRCWNGETMISPDSITRDGFALWKENSIPTGSHDIMQFTGLKDKNGVEIYEGDIVNCINKYSIKTNGDVVWLNAGFSITAGVHPATGDKLYASFQYQESIEVIGNIHQNPELLK